MSLSVNYPTTRPSLLLDFLNTQALDPRITFTRATSATYFDAAGVLRSAPAGQARFDYNPSTLTPLGLLIEEQRTNLVTYSEQFDDAAWAKVTATVTANTAIAPDGTLTGEKLIVNNAETSGYVSQSNSYTSGTAYTFSCYAKQGEQTDFRIITPLSAFGSSLNGIFNLSTGTVTSFTATSASITNVGNGWYRCFITATATSTTTGFLQLRSTYTGDGTSGIFIWGAQLEAGAFATSYIPTVASSVTRNADAASMTGTNFSSWFNNAEGTLFAEMQKTGNLQFQQILNLNDNSTNNSIALGFGSGAFPLRLDVTNGGVSQAQITGAASTTTNTNYKTAAAYKVDDFAITTNAGVVATDTLGTVPVVTQMGIGYRNVSTALTLTGHIRRIAYYPTRLTNEQLVALTR